MSASVPTSSRGNRLAGETSPYLRQHASNPVDWYPWSKEALEKAREENKPILLSVGYSACHWCHVMAHESFEDPEVARLMNEGFVNIKVDREERPDVDQLYMGVVQLMGRGGGWPLTVFLTPDLQPFFAGTYFPPTDRYGLPGFSKVLTSLREAWDKENAQVRAQGERFIHMLADMSTSALGLAGSEPLSQKDVVEAALTLEREVDAEYGGFGSQPKFPSPMALALLLRGHRRMKRQELLEAVETSLEKMALGGIFDQLGGGFHRYSVDGFWRVPHFEKMLYDNAQLIHLYSEAHQLSPRPLWKAVVERTVDYVAREMTSSEGGFFAAQDADSEGEEGKFFVWTPSEVDALLDPDAARLVKAHYGIRPEGNFEHGATVLSVVQSATELAQANGLSVESVEQTLEASRSKLFEARKGRVAPDRDEKVLAGWNGLMIRGLALASRAFDRPDWAELAARAAGLVVGRLWNPGKRLLFRDYSADRGRIEAFIEDYGSLAAGLVALYQATFDVQHLEAAEAIASAAVERFWDDEKGAYRVADKANTELPCATYALQDQAVPSGASMLCEALIGLSALTGRSDHLVPVERYLRRLRSAAARNPFGYAQLLLAVDGLLDGASSVTIVGAREVAQPLLDVVHHTYAPTVALSWSDSAASLAGPAAPVADAHPGAPGKAQAFFCRSFACQLPTSDPAELRAKLAAG